MRACVVHRVMAALLSLLIASTATAQEPKRVVAVNYPLHYMAERLLGAGAEVIYPVPEGTDPSFWQPLVADISLIQSADLILLNGAGFASWVDRVSLPRARLVNTSAAIEDAFITTQSITHSHGEGEEHSHSGTAAYVWLDPQMARAQAEAAAAGITRRGLAPEAEVEASLDALRADLAAADEEARAALSGLEGVTMISTHPRYQYLARGYDLSILSLEWEAGAMPTEAELADLAAMTEENGAQVLIWEAAPPDGAFASTEALGLVNVTFPPLATPPVDGDFLTVFNASVAALAEAGSTVQSQ